MSCCVRALQTLYRYFSYYGVVLSSSSSSVGDQRLVPGDFRGQPLAASEPDPTVLHPGPRLRHLQVRCQQLRAQNILPDPPGECAQGGLVIVDRVAW